jgi:hypothetical protein
MSDGDTFSLADESEKSNAEFFNGTLNSSFYSVAPNDDSITFNSTPLSQTPEPTSILLMVPMLVLFASWRMRKASARGYAEGGAVGAGMVRNARMACQNSWRLSPETTECAMPGRITNWRSPLGSCL